MNQYLFMLTLVDMQWKRGGKTWNLYLFVENRLCLPSITRLLAIITALPLSSKAILAFLVLCDLMQGVLLALLVLTVCFLGLRNVHL